MLGWRKHSEKHTWESGLETGFGEEGIRHIVSEVTSHEASQEQEQGRCVCTHPWGPWYNLTWQSKA